MAVLSTLILGSRARKREDLNYSSWGVHELKLKGTSIRPDGGRSSNLHCDSCNCARQGPTERVIQALLRSTRVKALQLICGRTRQAVQAPGRVMQSPRPGKVYRGRRVEHCLNQPTKEASACVTHNGSCRKTFHIFGRPKV